MKKLLLCAGPDGSPYCDSDWFRIDYDPKTNPHLISSIPPLPNKVINMGPWDRVAIIHGIEHFYPWSAKNLLTEICQILTPTGFVILEQPNLVKCAELIVAGDIDRGLQGIMGDGAHGRAGMLHNWAYTPETLARLCMECGFKRVVHKTSLFHDPKRDFRIEAYRQI